jgi:predicted GNAT family acetyltransferase
MFGRFNGLCSLNRVNAYIQAVDNKQVLRTTKRLEIEEQGQVAYLEFDTDSSGGMTIWHTEVPPSLRGRGLASELARAAFEHARINHLQVDVICPSALHYLSEQPEYLALVGKK